MTTNFKNSKIYIAGHQGMVGSSCFRLLKKNGYQNVFGVSSSELDLRNQASVSSLLNKERPDVIINAAAKVGGIWANNEFPYEFLIDNMQIQNNLFQNSLKIDVKKYIFLGSSCIYPKNAIQPLKEEFLLTGDLEKTNQWYAIAKISGVKLVESIRKQFGRDYIALMPTNLYGPKDNYDLQTSHVLPAMIRKFHEAKIYNFKTVSLWGTGRPLREFLYVDDLAEAILFSIENKMNKSTYNIGSGEEIMIKELASLIKQIVGYNGEIIWDSSKPDGTYRKLLDSSSINKLGWKFKTSLKEGVEKTYLNFLEEYNEN